MSSPRLSLKVSHANFGGKNDSPFEFFNSSDAESALFFEKTNLKYNSDSDERGVGDILKLYLDYFDLTNMIRDTNNWFIQNMNVKFLSQLSGIIQKH